MIVRTFLQSSYVLWLLNNCPDMNPNFLWRTAMCSQPDSLLNPSKTGAKHRHPPQYLSLPGLQNHSHCRDEETGRAIQPTSARVAVVSPFIPSCLTPWGAGLAYYTDLFSDFSVVSLTGSLQGQGSARAGSKSSRRSLWGGTGRTEPCQLLLDLV